MIKKVLIGIAVIAVITAGVYANGNRTPDSITVQVETLSERDLAAVVTGSGKIRPFKEVDISSNVMGRIIRLAIEEGQNVVTGDFLLEIDPVRYRSAVDQVEASISSAAANVELSRQNLEYAREVLDRREGLYRQDLLAEEQYTDALQAVRREERNVQMRTQDLERLKAQLKQSEYDLSLVTFVAPIDGVVTKLNVEEGETAVTGTMNNPGTVLLTIADLSVVEAEIEIDETDIVNVTVGQAAEVRIDAFPEKVFSAQVSEVGKSPITTAGGANQAINFKVVVRLLETVPGARPGLSCTADITTATRENVLSVPIQSLILREVELDADGNIIQRDPLQALLDAATENADDDGDFEEVEGAFVVRDGRAVFVPIEIGIAGERHFEVLEGLTTGEQVIVGPFNVIRTLQTDERVDAETAPRRRQATEEVDS